MGAQGRKEDEWRELKRNAPRGLRAGLCCGECACDKGGGADRADSVARVQVGKMARMHEGAPIIREILAANRGPATHCTRQGLGEGASTMRERIRGASCV